MSDKVYIVGLGLSLIAALFLLPLISTLVGAFTGWIVGFVFPETILGFFAGLGVTSLKTWQIGAALGFVGGFFKSHKSKTSK